MTISYLQGTPAHSAGIADTIIKAFFNHFKGIGLVERQVRGALTELVDPSRFVIAVDDETGRVMGTAGIADAHGYAVNAHKDIICKHFGWFLGQIATPIMASEFLRPINIAAREGHIAYVAIDEEYRGKGYSKAMLEAMFTIFDYEEYTLDVVEGNERVLPLYEGFGFEVTQTEAETMCCIKPFSFRYCMHKPNPQMA